MGRNASFDTLHCPAGTNTLPNLTLAIPLATFSSFPKNLYFSFYLQIEKKGVSDVHYELPGILFGPQSW